MEKLTRSAKDGGGGCFGATFFFSSFLLFDEPGDVIDEDPEDAIDVDDDVVAADDDEDFLTLFEDPGFCRLQVRWNLQQ